MAAQDKASGKSQKITITSDKGRLSEDEINRMVREAEENAEADKQAKARVEAKNQLEAYLYSVRASAESLKEKIDAAEHEALTKAATEGLKWLEEHPTEETGAYEEKRKEVETVASPIISKAYAAGAGAGPGGAGDGPAEGPDGDAGPTVEEVE